MIKLFTIGFTQKKAEQFFQILQQAGVQKIIDTRLWPDTQLSGFARKKDLPYFLKSLANVDYEHDVRLAPSEDILRDYKGKKINWSEYEQRYKQLLDKRQIAKTLSPDSVHMGCFLCAEHEAVHCHRRLLAEYLQRSWPKQSIEIIHL